MTVASTHLKTEQIKRIHSSYMMLMHISKRWLVQQLQKFGLTVPQFVTLAALVAHKHPCTMRDLTNVTFHDPPTMTGVIDRMVKIALVQRTRSETDRRVVLVEATEAGSSLIAQIENSLFQESQAGFETLSEKQLLAFEETLSHMLRIYLKQYGSFKDTDLDAEIEKLEQFVDDPICFMKLENSKTI